ncbi:hypothetical protein C1645_837357 [Glomus cerebriforme]|uniref:Uncharacterized protein n=1 Tax=Glomus cerebriforme TaxID=658196 RepID=A0A397S5E3_9GLOM|nr:hypothetical protein C1645_837357 [Glomus cerebriforme]
MSTVSTTTNSELNDEEKRRKNIFKILKFLKPIRKRASNLSEEPMTEILNLPVTEISLRKYENAPGQAQEFLDRVGRNFKWPVSMNDCDRGTAFFDLADDDALEFDDEAGLNLISFFDNLDKGTFDEHKDSWVLIYKQEVKKYGSEYTSKELEDLEDEMPGAIYLPVDKLRREGLVKVATTRTLHAKRTRNEHMARIQVRRLGSMNSITLECNFHDPAEGNKKYI